jgi:hypothetical protein
MPDWAWVHRELRRPNVTLALLWEEYRAGAPDGFGYSWFCDLYRGCAGRLKPTMRQAHLAGEKLFVDFAGRTAEVIDGLTGQIIPAQIFVAALGVSSFTYAEAVWSQKLPELPGRAGARIVLLRRRRPRGPPWATRLRSVIRLATVKADHGCLIAMTPTRPASSRRRYCARSSNTATGASSTGALLLRQSYWPALPLAIERPPTRHRVHMPCNGATQG